jgi:hypothetical protein
MQDVIEVAKTGRATCRTCKATIAKGELRFGEEEFNAFSGNGDTTFKWHHLACAAKSRPAKVKPVLDAYEGDVPNRDAIVADMNEAFKKVKPPFPYAEVAPSGRSRCQQCDEAIPKGELRVAFEREVDTGSFVTKGAGYLHLACVEDYASDKEGFIEAVTTNVHHLDPADRARVQAAF